MGELIHLKNFLKKPETKEEKYFYDPDQLISVMIIPTDDIAADLVSRAEGEGAIFPISTEILLTELSDRINNLEKLCILLNEK
tara:strand:+ start:4139 stop:4387 length:249 start_codon:yes stop_codon:yes gene_type:complete